MQIGKVGNFKLIQGFSQGGRIGNRVMPDLNGIRIVIELAEKEAKE